MSKLENPWLNLPKKPPFLAPCDKDVTVKLSDFYDLHLELLPSPFSGNIDTAKVVMLLLNPGYIGAESDIELRSSVLQQAFLDNLDPQKSKLFAIAPEFDWTAGGKWLQEKLAGLFKAGVSHDDIYKNFMIVEYFPYHSATFNVKPGTELPSQKYSFELVEKAIDKGAMILLMRGKNWWYDAVPRLEKYPNLIKKPNSLRNVVISENNLGKDNFNKLVKLLKS
jgi:hypothetical protein